MQAGASRTPGQLYAAVIGAVYLLVGLVGFFVADEFTKGSADDELIIFRLNHLHNLIHVALGVGWLAASRTAAAAKGVNTLFGGVLLLVALLGFTEIDLVHTLLNVTESTDPDNFLHLVTGGLALYFGTAGAGERPVATT
ncbi:MAG: DUF4383 domain-containing protein [Actinomycetota bacterium]|nr:DUF4383 domain-containing protein [Actinomycetota bacterium]